MDKVRNFMIKYQDRILYATDNGVNDSPGTDYDAVMQDLRKDWLAQWIFLATDSVVGVKGLQLPKEVIDKIYCKNAERYFHR
jgi:predicted TIM-barrel fold metal-dependent hydrolase